MRHLVQPNRWSCLATSFAMVLDVSLGEINRFLGHDGSAVMFPTTPDHLGKRGYTIPELTEFALTRDIAVISLWMSYEQEYCFRHKAMLGNKDIIFESLEKLDAVAVGRSKDFGNRHAVAWDHSAKMYIDPDGKIHKRCPLTVDAYLCVAPLKQPLNILSALETASMTKL